MRLIDADKLELKETVRIQLCGLKEYVALYSYTKDQIEEAPTVKAISIEWIKNYARHKASKGLTEIDCYWQYWEDDVLKIVDEWEKENGRSE